MTIIHARAAVPSLPTKLTLEEFYLGLKNTKYNLYQFISNLTFKNQNKM